jgi:hypothetical protein
MKGINMNKFKIAISIGALFCTLFAMATSASAAEFIAKKACPVHLKEIGCFNGGEGGEQKFTFESNGKLVSLRCKKIKLATNKLYEIEQPALEDVQLNGPQKIGAAEKVTLQQEEKGEAAVILPEYEECESLGLKAEIRFEITKAKCVYEFSAVGFVSIAPGKCRVVLDVPAAGCEVTLEGKENEAQKEVKYKELAGKEVEFTLNVKGMKGKQNGKCGLGAAAAGEGTNEGRFKVKEAEFK